MACLFPTACHRTFPLPKSFPNCPRANRAREDLKTKPQQLESANQALNAAKRTEAALLNGVTTVVRADLTRFIGSREGAIEDLETAIAFIGEATQPAPAAANDNKKKAPPAVGESPEEDKERRAYVGN